jgi:hypothetical protein
METITDVRADQATFAAMVTNLTEIGNQLTTEEVAAGVGWYRVAQRTAARLAYRYGTTVHRAAGVISALSPRCRWATNVDRAEHALATGNPTGFRMAIQPAEAIMGGAKPLDALTGQKRRNFHRNITGNLRVVTLDIWALRAAWAWDVDERGSKMLGRKGVYETTEAAYRVVAGLYGLQPAEFQAAVWCHIRGSHE